jgi:hypothetical protein
MRSKSNGVVSACVPYCHAADRAAKCGREASQLTRTVLTFKTALFEDTQGVEST